MRTASEQTSSKQASSKQAISKPTVSKQTLTIHYDGQHWLATDAAHNMMSLSVAENETLPSLPETALVHTLLLPAEHIFSRSFRLPLANPKHIDQDILAQELEEHSSETAESWWLSWQAGKHDEGVAGIMFGMPESMRQHIEQHESWQHSQYITCDIWLRLNAQLERSLKQQPEIEQSKPSKKTTSPVAVFDCDSSGVFFGLWQPGNEKNTQGFWQAMRRLNWLDAAQPSDSLIEDIKRSLLSMGWHDEQAIATGCMQTPLYAALNFTTWQGLLCDSDKLASRPDATMNAASMNAATNRTIKSLRNTDRDLNFRHGRWRLGSHLTQLSPWYRSMTWIAMLMLLWTANMLWQNHQLQTQLVEQQHAISAAFHTGLPNEPVLLDALAQLRQAAGGNHLISDPDKRRLAAQWLRHIEDINKVYQQTPWTINEISFQQGIMSMAGQSNDLQQMNHILKALQQQSGQDIKIQDTDLSQNRVRFKMVWP